MRSRLDQIQDWTALIREAEYEPYKMAEICLVSLRQLERFVKANFQQTPKEWVTKLRMVEAESLLRKGTSAKSTALTLGYKQLSHFSREFKRHAGVAPTIFTSLVLSQSRKKIGARGSVAVAFR